MEGSESPEGAERSDRTWECVKLELVWLNYGDGKKETVWPRVREAVIMGRLIRRADRVVRPYGMWKLRVSAKL